MADEPIEQDPADGSGQATAEPERPPRDAGPARKLKQEQSLADLEQALGDREQILGDRAQDRVDLDQSQLDSDRDAEDAADPTAARVFDDRQARVTRAQATRDTEQVALDGSQAGRDAQQGAMDELREVHELPLSEQPTPWTASKLEHDAYLRAIAARERAEAALARAQAGLLRAAAVEQRMRESAGPDRE